MRVSRSSRASRDSSPRKDIPCMGDDDVVEGRIGAPEAGQADLDDHGFCGGSNWQLRRVAQEQVRDGRWGSKPSKFPSWPEWGSFAGRWPIADEDASSPKTGLVIPELDANSSAGRHEQ